MSFTILNKDDANKRPGFPSIIPANAQQLHNPGGMFTIHSWEQELYDKEKPKKLFEVVTRNRDTIVIIPVLKNGNILIVHEEQPGRSPYWCTPRGFIEPGELPTDAAIKEIIEETGYTSGIIEMVHKRILHPKVNQAIFICIARDLDGKQEQKLDGGEKITLHEIERFDFVNKALNEQFDEHELNYFVMKKMATLDLRIWDKMVAGKWLSNIP